MLVRVERGSLESQPGRAQRCLQAGGRGHLGAGKFLPKETAAMLSCNGWAECLHSLEGGGLPNNR